MGAIGLGLLGTGSATSAGTTITVTNTTGAVIPANTTIHISGTWDNTNTTTAPTITCSTVGGGTATANHATAVGAGVTTTAGSGVWHQCFRVKTVSSISAGATIATLTSNQSAVVRAAHAEGWKGATTSLRGAVNTAGSASGAPSIAVGGSSLVDGDLLIGSESHENNALMTGDTDSTLSYAAWSTLVGTFTTGGAANANVGTGTQWKVVTGPGTQTYNPTGGVADSVACIISLQPEAQISLASYQFFADGTEAGSTSLAAQDTGITADLSAADASLFIRMRLQQFNSAPPLSGDDYQLQWEKNASGTWTNVGAATSGVSGFATSNLTDGQATTNRLGAGTGTFVAGKACRDGLLDDLGWTSAASYTEVLFSVTLKMADLAHDDVIRFRVLKNGETTNVFYTLYPTATVSTTPVGQNLEFDDSDDLSITDYVELVVEIDRQDALGLTDLVEFGGSRAYNTQDALNLSDIAQSAVSYGRSAQDPLTLSDSAVTDLARSLTHSAQDALGVTDSEISSSTLDRQDSTGLRDSAAAELMRALSHSAQDALNLSDTVQPAASRTYTTQDSMGLSGTVAGELFKSLTHSAQDALGLSDTSTDVSDASRQDSVGISDALITFVADRTYNKQDTAGLADSITTFVTRGVDKQDLAGLTDTETSISTLARQDSANLTDSATISASGASSFSDLMGLSDVLMFTISRVLSVQDSAGLTDTYGTAIARVFSYSDNLGITDYETSTSTIDRFDLAKPTDTVATGLSKALAFSDLLGLSDTHSRTGSLVYGKQDVFGLSDSMAFQVTVPTGGRPMVYLGGSWVPKPGKVWNGTAWVEKPWKVWNGSSWQLIGSGS